LPKPGEKKLAVRTEDHCFHPDTLVHTSSGFKKIQDIVPNDLVYSYNIEEDKVELKPVLNIFKNKIFAYLSIASYYKRTGGKVITTPSHKFLTSDGYKFAVELEDMKYKTSMMHLGYSDDLRKIIMGILLGDGCLHKCGGRVKIVHSYKQKDYTDYLYKLFKPYSPTYKTAKDKKGYKFTLLTLPSFDKSWQNIYDNNRKKRITKEWLDEMGSIGLAFYFLDDGSFSNNCIEFSTQSFLLDDIHIFVNWLKDVYDIDAKIYTIGHDSRFNNQDPSPE
jgi:hypothetical protein